MRIFRSHFGAWQVLSIVALVVCIGSAGMSERAHAAALRNGPGHIIHRGTGAKGAVLPSQHPATVYQLDAGGFDGETSASDPSTGNGDDQWVFDFPSTMHVSVTITDEYIVGDNFTVYIDQTPIGTTPAEPLNGPTYSTGTETANAAPGMHTISLVDVGALYWSNQGYTYMFPAGFHITIQFGPSTAKRSIIFVHGITQNASTITPTSSDFGPILAQLQSIYGSAVDVLPYVDDRSKASGSTHSCPSSVYPPCASQSHVLDNALELAQEISKDYTASKHKVVVIGYSMGAAIIRTMLAGCPDITSAGVLTNYAHLPLKCPIAHTLVDNVFFINGVQQGSWLMDAGYSLQSASTNNLLNYTVYSIVSNYATQKLGLNLLYPAEGDLTPESANILAYDAQPLPNGIHYFNFYGNIKVHLGVAYLIFSLDAPPISLGDLVIFPGQENPTTPTLLGGAQFCPQCSAKNGYSARVVNSTTSFDEWALTKDVYSNFRIDVADLPYIGIPTALKVQGQSLYNDLSTAPMNHLDIPKNTSAIQVADSTRTGQTTSIADEIARQLESQDDIIPTTPQ